MELLGGQQDRIECGKVIGIMCWYSRNVSRVFHGKEHVVCFVLNPNETNEVVRHLTIFHYFPTDVLHGISNGI